MSREAMRAYARAKAQPDFTEKQASQNLLKLQAMVEALANCYRSIHTCPLDSDTTEAALNIATAHNILYKRLQYLKKEVNRTGVSFVDTVTLPSFTGTLPDAPRLLESGAPAAQEEESF